MPSFTLVDPLCEECSDPVTAANLISTVEGDRLCPDCAEELVRCDGCAAHTRTTSLTTEDTLLCSECLSGWERCGDCDAYARRIRTVIGGADVCDHCAEHYSSCDDCTELAAETYPVDGGNRVCPTCEYDDYRECSECFTLIRREETYCENCLDEHPSHDAVHGYDYKPAPHFHGAGPLYLGLELEIKTPSGHFDDAVDTVLAHVRDLAYLKEDSSIRPCGFELVTHPMDYAYAQERFPWPLLARLRLLGCYTDADVGIHVHVSRTGFSSPAHAYRWLKFVYRNEAPVTTLARRSSTWAEFSPWARSQVRDYAKGQRSAARYQAINVRPAETFELRVFASSLTPQQVQAALAFAAASVEYTRGLSAADIARRRGWEWTAFTTWVRSRPQYSPLLAEMEALACAS
ncbi:hypothetical protein OH799_01390 [Nocardia sp. NBC_00881]|uniref:hypothetical protein n=1 Tax=Nocardia sp. NBC_00881 TaxID=2975995 RepID=UPI00386645FD|nr:hypothetical protein OH799_01390 [Nocardia sp. NBC_00881]